MWIGGDLASFDIVYQPCRFGLELVEQKNPLTGEVQTSLAVKPLSSHDVKAVRDLLETSSAAGSDEDGCYLVQLGDGGVAEVFADHLETGCMAASRQNLTPDLLRFLFDLLKAADWIMLPAMEGNPAITAPPGRAECFADCLTEVVCNTVDELGVMLTQGFDG